MNLFKLPSIFTLISCFWLVTASFFPYIYPSMNLNRFMKVECPTDGEALFLTPYIQKGSIDEAQSLSEVTLTRDLGFKSHAGFFTVNEIYNSSLYFWYFPPFSENEEAPVILWLQGGPGATSLYGLFTEIGPLTANNEGFIVRKYHWALEYHLIFIDNPVGTGFSFTEHENGYCTDQNCIAENLYNALEQFFTLFPKLRNNKFFISGESYAGKYIPSLAMYIHKQNQLNCMKINLQGLLIGNGYCDPLNQMDYGKYLFQIGLLDAKQQEVFEKVQKNVEKAIVSKNWEKAAELMDNLMDGELTDSSYFKSYTGFNNYYNYLYTNDSLNMSIYEKLLSNKMVRQSIHVGNLPFNQPENVFLHLVKDILKSVADTIAELLSHYRILFYNGQFDIIVAYPLTENFLRKLDFSSAQEYKTAKRSIWRVDGKVAGYIKKAGNLTEVLVRNAGHMVPRDQPKWALDMLNKFIKNKALTLLVYIHS